MYSFFFFKLYHPLHFGKEQSGKKPIDKVNLQDINESRSSCENYYIYIRAIRLCISNNEKSIDSQLK